ncbi:MAG: GGDEF domain-containing protein [Myxococcota bacterium]
MSPDAWLHVAFLLVILALAVRLRTALAQERELAGTDALTGIANRRRFDEAAALALRAMGTAHVPVTAVYLDLDGFKQVNDRLGHAGGDALLKLVATTLAGAVRRGDTVARLGGDEFAMLLVGADQECASALLARLQATLRAALRPWPVTASIGAVSFSTPPATTDEMLRRTDAVLYEVKRAGKDDLRIAVS